MALSREEKGRVASHRLRALMPRSSLRRRQPAILHTTLARMLKPPSGSSRAAVQRLAAAMEGMTSDLCGLESILREVWYIQERHLLALALNGAYSKERAQLQCPAQGGGAGTGYAATTAA